MFSELLVLPFANSEEEEFSIHKHKDDVVFACVEGKVFRVSPVGSPDVIDLEK